MRGSEVSTGNGRRAHICTGASGRSRAFRPASRSGRVIGMMTPNRGRRASMSLNERLVTSTSPRDVMMYTRPLCAISSRCWRVGGFAKGSIGPSSGVLHFGATEDEITGAARTPPRSRLVRPVAERRPRARAKSCVPTILGRDAGEAPARMASAPRRWSARA
jgi:hypothetical protein